MRRLLPLDTEILRGLHQADPEELLPEPVHRHPRGERVLRGHQPLCQAEPVGRSALRGGRQPLGHLRADLLALEGVFTALQDMGLPRFRAILHHQGRGNGLLQVRELLPGFRFPLGGLDELCLGDRIDVLQVVVPELRFLRLVALGRLHLE